MISIVMTYYNRKKQLINTLNSINGSTIKDIEIIIIDDASDDEHRIEDLQEEFNLKLIRIDKKDKWWVNPCVSFNIGIKESKGDIIVLQNPECYHVGDVLSSIKEIITDDNYITLSTYSFTKNLSDIILNVDKEYLLSLPQVASGGSESLGWYNHIKYRPKYFHFCSAITINNMNKLNGFDERYAHGISYDDAEIIERIKRLGLKLEIIDNVSVIHQYHDVLFYNMKNFGILHERNKQLYFNITLKENKIKVNL
jgi:glycosyltransferase involved in cell wall biosynthesis